MGKMWYNLINEFKSLLSIFLRADFRIEFCRLQKNSRTY